MTINDKNLKIEAGYRGNPGGQCVSVVTSAIRITHIPTGIIAECSTERSQERNKRVAVAMIKYGLAELGWRGDAMSNLGPFSNGTDFIRWTERNCDRCWKSKVSATTGRSRCPIENALAIASVSNGIIPQRIAKRLGWDGKTYLKTDCKEREEKRPKTQKKTPSQIELL